MAETAVGLFQDRESADHVVELLCANGVPRDAIRTVCKHTALPVKSVQVTPSLDFAAALRQDLRAIGATEEECEAYLEGFRKGSVLIFVTGTRSTAENAVALMTRSGSVETEEFEGAAGALPGVHLSEASSHDMREKIARSRMKSEGARLFTW